MTRILILGGSQGAHAINLAMMATVPELQRRRSGIDVVHQTGERDAAAVRAAYDRAGVRVRVEAFLDPVVTEIRAADVVVCRAGATTLAELAALGRPAILVPLPGAADDHQRKNAQTLAGAGAAVVIDERDLAGRLADAIERLLGDPGRLVTMARAMRAFAKPDAAVRIVDKVLELAALPDVRTPNVEGRR